MLLSSAASAASAADWRLVWADEFNGPKNSQPDPSKWKFDVGSSGWGNHELEEYTRSLDNVWIDGEGHLAIRVRRPGPGKYTSGRIKTLGLLEVRHGKIEARIKVPFGNGLWAAFWMLGTDVSRQGWPEAGEIDIMENIGREPRLIHGTLHGPGYSGAEAIGAPAQLASGSRFADAFHVYGIEWSEGVIAFFLDGKQYARLTPASLPRGGRWVFDHPFFLLLNVAVGGDWPRSPDNTTSFPQTMLVDWVRVWRSASGGP